MPLIADLTVEGSTSPMVLPPFDIEWVWFCHTLNPVSVFFVVNFCLVDKMENVRRENIIAVSSITYT